jgi:hypothetical protein
MFWSYILTIINQVEKHRYRRKCATTRPPLHNQSAENTLDIIPKRGLIQRNNKNMKINMYHGNIQHKIQK